MANQIMPGIQPMIQTIDRLIHDAIPDLNYAVKWGSAFYGTNDQGWLIEVAAYHVSANIVFLKGAEFNPQPPLGTGESRYFKIRKPEELEKINIERFLQQASRINGWK